MLSEQVSLIKRSVEIEVEGLAGDTVEERYKNLYWSRIIRLPSFQQGE